MSSAAASIGAALRLCSLNRARCGACLRIGWTSRGVQTPLWAHLVEAVVLEQSRR
jgi:hypothetical protein